MTRQAANRAMCAMMLLANAEVQRRKEEVDGQTVEWVDDKSCESEEESSGYYDEHWATNKPTTRYYYDGQMGFEDDFTIVGGLGTPDVTVTRYALGARGIDGIETRVGSQSPVAVYPVYDGHGNMIATLARNGDSFTRQHDREYDAWGVIASGSGGDQGYVANLGHRRDAESGLTYMRARYYEPGTGRFISEDRVGDGLNWFAYCKNNPVALVDSTGSYTEPDQFTRLYGIADNIHKLMGALAGMAACASKSLMAYCAAANGFLFLVAWVGEGGPHVNSPLKHLGIATLSGIVAVFQLGFVAAALQGMGDPGQLTVAQHVLATVSAHFFFLVAFMNIVQIENAF